MSLSSKCYVVCSTLIFHLQICLFSVVQSQKYHHYPNVFRSGCFYSSWHLQNFLQDLGILFLRHLFFNVVSGDSRVDVHHCLITRFLWCFKFQETSWVASKSKQKWNAHIKRPQLWPASHSAADVGFQLALLQNARSILWHVLLVTNTNLQTVTQNLPTSPPEETQTETSLNTSVFDRIYITIYSCCFPVILP